MATRIEQILTHARLVLADKESQRWTNEDLLLLLDEGHKDICRHSEILTGVQEVSLTPGSAYFTLPVDCWMLTRIAYLDYVLPFITHEQLDSRYPISNYVAASSSHLSVDWQQDEGTPEALIFDRTNVGEGKLYPIPDNTIRADTTFSSDFGLVASSSDAFLSNPFGVITAAVTQDFGVVVDELSPILCYYVKNPAAIDSIYDNLATPAMFDTALKYYVIGNAFMMDLDQEYQAKGVQQLGYYNRELELAQRSASRDNARAAANTTSYRRGF